MKYNIDTKENFDIITPINDLFDQDLAEKIQQFLSASILKNRSAIIDFSSIQSIENNLNQTIIDWHHKMYDSNLSFALCEMNDEVKKSMQENEEFDILNITPKQIEAIDIVAMEGLERELLGDEDFDF
jgi:anti-anti-sigma regulatory factor